MKSAARVTAVLVMLLMPVLAFAESTQTQMQIVSPPNMPYTGSYDFKGIQQFSGGPFMMPGMMGMGMHGLGGGSVGFGVVSIASTIIYLINSVLVPLLFAVSFIVFLYGVAKAYILSPGDEEAVKSGHKILLWGLIGFAVMVSVWGLVNVVVATFGLASSSGSAYPTAFGSFSR